MAKVFKKKKDKTKRREEQKKNKMCRKEAKAKCRFFNSLGKRKKKERI